VGTAHAVLERGLVAPRDGMLVQECAAGLLPVRIETFAAGRRLHVRAPRGIERLADPRAAVASLHATRFGALRPALIDNGPHWWCIELADEQAVRSLRPALDAMAQATRESGAVGVAAYARCEQQPYALVVRAFVPADGIAEDPVTGSANAAIAAWLHANGRLPAASYIASQGREVGRDGIVHCAVDADGEAWIGGETQTVIAGRLDW
jgi:PhzF family phenazine biosynthesis protein